MKTVTLEDSHLAQQAHDHIMQWIRTGRLRLGQKMPSERELAVEFGMSHLTVRRGLAKLEADGIIVKQPRVGNFVKRIKPAMDTNQIALVLPSWLLLHGRSHPVSGQIASGVASVIGSGESPLTIMHCGAGKMWQELGDSLVQRGVHGIVLWPWTRRQTRDDLQKLKGAGIEVVCMANINPMWSDLPAASVRVNWQSTLTQCVSHLQELGHQRIAMVRYGMVPEMMDCESYDIHHYDCFAAIRDHLIEIAHAATVTGRDYSVLRRMFETKPLPTAIIVPDEYAASELFRWCYRLRLRVPEDLSVVALNDNTPQIHPIPLSAPDTPAINARMAQTATQLLLRRLRGEVLTEQEISIRCDMQWKASVARPPKHEVVVDLQGDLPPE